MTQEWTHREGQGRRHGIAMLCWTFNKNDHASDQASLNSCTVQRENSKHRKKVVDFFIFSSSQHFSFVKFLRLLPFQSQYLLLVELMST